jgi:hypothetical protein
MTVKIVVYGDKLDLADEIGEEFVQEAKDVAGEAGDIMLAEAQRLAKLRVGTAQTAAPEGQPPEFDTGAFYRSLKRITPRVKGRVASSGIQSNDPGAARIEWGATDSRGIRTLPHPIFRPAAANSEQPITDLCQRKLGST